MADKTRVHRQLNVDASKNGVRGLYYTRAVKKKFKKTSPDPLGGGPAGIIIRKTRRVDVTLLRGLLYFDARGEDRQ